MRTDELDFDLPQERIARAPAHPRDACRLMVVSRSDENAVEHRVFRDLTDLLRPRDLLVTNISRVVPARIAGHRADTGGKVEGLFVSEPTPGQWSILLKANTRLAPGHTILLHAPTEPASEARLELIARDGDGWIARVLDPITDDGRPATASDILARIGATPLPPYILAARKAAADTTPDAADRDWYQTVYADAARSRSVAAPTAGMHFTPELLDRLAAGGVRRARVTLHVGIGTFKPIEAERVEDHPIHAEDAEVPPDTIAAMRDARAASARIIAVGTTSVRAIESLPHPLTPEILHRGTAGPTALFIRPGFAMRWTDGLITNFHLPRSTLLALVGALFPGGVPRVLDLYRQAIAHQYRFYSYGDAMLILP